MPSNVTIGPIDENKRYIQMLNDKNDKIQKAAALVEATEHAFQNHLPIDQERVQALLRAKYDAVNSYNKEMQDYKEMVKSHQKAVDAAAKRAEREAAKNKQDGKY